MLKGQRWRLKTGANSRLLSYLPAQPLEPFPACSLDGLVSRRPARRQILIATGSQPMRGRNELILLSPRGGRHFKHGPKPQDKLLEERRRSHGRQNYYGLFVSTASPLREFHSKH